MLAQPTRTLEARDCPATRRGTLTDVGTARSLFTLTVIAALTVLPMACAATTTHTSLTAHAAYRYFITPGQDGANCEMGIHAPSSRHNYVTCARNRPRKPYRTYVKVTMNSRGKLTFCHGFKCISNSGPAPTLKVGRSVRFGPFRCTSLTAGVRCTLMKTGHGFHLRAHSAASSTSSATAPNRLIVLGRSIAGIRLGESRANVQQALGKGRTTQRGLVSYFGGRLVVNYWFHDGLTTRVQALQTRWAGFHSRSGIHVGSSRAHVRALHFACGDGTCSRAAGPMPDAPGTVLTMRRGKVAKIDIFYA